MRALYTFFLFSAAYVCASAQSRDLSIAFKQYSAGQHFTLTNNSSVDIQPEFIITNHGPETVKKGDSIFVTVRLNDMETDMQLRDKSDPKSRIPDFIILDADLPAGSSVSYNPSPYAPLTITSFYLSLFGFERLDLCFRTFGAGRSSYGNTYPEDTRPDNNEVCVSIGDPISGISDFQEYRARIYAYPNPASDQIFFSLPEELKGQSLHLSITNPGGSIVVDQLLRTPETGVGLKSLDPGYYLYILKYHKTIIGQGWLSLHP